MIRCAVACLALLPGCYAVAQRKKDRPVLFGPGGQPLPATPLPASAVELPAVDDAVTAAGASGVDDPEELAPGGGPGATPSGSSDVQVTDPADGPGAGPSARPKMSYQVKVALDVELQQIPAALVVLLPFDPVAAYRTRIESARDQFLKSRDLMVAAAEKNLVERGVNVRDPRRAAAGMIERQFMAQVWDAAFNAVSAAQVGLVYSAALSGGETAIGAVLASAFDGARMWVTSRANVLGERFGAWAVPVQRDAPMPVIIVLNVDSLHPLRMNYARVRV